MKRLSGIRKKALVYQKVDRLCVIVSFSRYVERLDEETWFRENQTKSGICHVKKSRREERGTTPKIGPRAVSQFRSRNEILT